MLGNLYVVGTPIGNLEDITYRAVRILEEVNLIAAEDTRHTGKLLQYYQIKTPQISYHIHNRQQRHQQLLQYLQQGQNIALVTDAGMPTISDPGYDLVNLCLSSGVTVIPIPGVTAAITAIAISGLPTDHFVFEGFLPLKSKIRQERLQFLAKETRTLIFYESPHRLITTLEDLAINVGNDRTIVITRELTKIHEEIWRGTLQDAIALYQQRQPKGEYTLVLAGAAPITTELSEIAIKEQLKDLLEQGMTKSEASRHLSQINTISRRYIYQLSQEI